VWGQDGWIFFFFACVWTETESRSIITQKKRTRPISSRLDRTSLVSKGFIMWLSRKFFLRDTAGSPERTRWLHLAHLGSQSQRRIWFILPIHGASHIINPVIFFHKLQNYYSFFFLDKTHFLLVSPLPMFPAVKKPENSKKERSFFFIFVQILFRSSFF